jgi:hypothetical protein
MAKKTIHPLPRINPIAKRLNAEADRFAAKAKDLLMLTWHRLGDKTTISEKDARLIRDHEIRAEVYRSAARIAVEEGL